MVKVLIIEDEPTEIPKLTKWLGLHTGEYVHFNPMDHMQGEGADQFQRVWTALKEALKQHDPKVLILDLSIDPHRAPNFNGQSLCRDLRNRCSMLGLIVVSYLPGDMGLNGYEQWGANHGWTKPWSDKNNPDPGPGGEANIIRDLITLRSRRVSETCKLD